MLYRLYLFLLTMLSVITLTAQPAAYILDADTGNEMDDLYAIARALSPDGLKVLSLQSAHFNNVQLLTDPYWNSYPTDSINTLEISQGLNEQLKAECGQWMLPALSGCDQMLGFAWGYYPGAPVPSSPATRFIIEQARKASPDAKLPVICLGASTNVAAALAVAPEIAGNLKVYLLGARYDAKTKAWDKNEFNIRNDLNAFDLLLNHKDLELWVMPANVARALTFQRAATFQQIKSCSTPLCRRLTSRWEEVGAGTSWIMWDLALIEAVIHPEFATSKSVRTPPENTRRRVKVYTQINAPAMEANFWEALLSWQAP
ncbi:MAG: nucleoside hydrolase [Phaeodactylibacter sp.]|uniref:nucleoside hydrolase n=1 Tax=Phaeodactylibacter sp. TaxID=1940289 RepID=UPI0032EA95F1